MKVVEQFKRRILDLAIRGKLVPQDPNDEPASELLARIRAEKESLIKAGKIKKGKSSTIGSDGAAYEKLREGEFLATKNTKGTKAGGPQSSAAADVPFKIPKGWAWCRLSDVLLSLHTGLNPRQFFKLNTPDANNYYVTIRELKDNQVIFNNRTDRINDTALLLCNKRSNLEVGDILFGGTGSIGVTAIVSTSPVNWNIKEGVYALKPEQRTIFPLFLLYLLQTPTIKKFYLEQAVGATVLSVPMKGMNTLPIPLPPLAEQKRIVARIEELFKIADSLGEAADGLEAMAKRLDKKILDLAIRGELVPQDPNDEPASELLKRIAATSHKSPCKNHETPIDPPFAIPESWEWVKLGCVLKQMTTKLPTGEWFDYIDIDAIDNLHNKVIVPKHLPTARAPSRATRELKNGDVLFSVVRPYLRNIALVDTKLAHCIASTGFYVCRPSLALFPHYLFVLMLSEYVVMGLNAFMKGDNSPSIRNSQIQDYLIPLPPLAEQKRIVTKIEELRKVTQALTM